MDALAVESSRRVTAARLMLLPTVLAVPVVVATALMLNLLVLIVTGPEAWGAPGRPTAMASCSAAQSVEQALTNADVVFIGTVTVTRSRDRVAFVRVEDRWKGSVAARVDVFGGPADVNAATSVDRTYRTGQRYLFFVQEPGAHGTHGAFAGRYQDSGCSATRLYTDDLAAFRPATARAVKEAPATHGASAAAGRSTTVWLWPALAGAVLLVAAAAVLALLGRRPRDGRRRGGWRVPTRPGGRRR